MAVPTEASLSLIEKVGSRRSLGGYESRVSEYWCYIFGNKYFSTNFMYRLHIVSDTKCDYKL